MKSNEISRNILSAIILYFLREKENEVKIDRKELSNILEEHMNSKYLLVVEQHKDYYIVNGIIRENVEEPEEKQTEEKPTEEKSKRKRRTKTLEKTKKIKNSL